MATAVGRTATALGAFYRRLAARIGKAKALTATARKIAILFYRAILAARHDLSFIAAVVTTASSLPAAVQARPRAGLDRASSRQRSKVPVPIPSSRATKSIAALSGGSNRATALSLNACPYRAKSVLHRRPRG